MGECKNCGECCKYLTFTLPGLGNDRIFQKYYKAHGCKIKGNTISVPMICPHLTETNMCDIHEKKPFLCREFKGKDKGRFSVPKGCGYNDTQ